MTIQFHVNVWSSIEFLIMSCGTGVWLKVNAVTFLWQSWSGTCKRHVDISLGKINSSVVLKTSRRVQISNNCDQIWYIHFVAKALLFNVTPCVRESCEILCTWCYVEILYVSAKLPVLLEPRFFFFFFCILIPLQTKP